MHVYGWVSSLITYSVLGVLGHVVFVSAGQASASSDVIPLVTEGFDAHVQKGTWLVKFYAPWCGHCRALEPIYEQVATELRDEIKVAKIDGSQEQALSARFHVTGYPTIFLIRGEDVYKFGGSRSASGIKFFATKGWQDSDKLGFFTSPFSLIGRLKGYIIGGGVYVLKFHKMLVDKHKMSGIAAGGLIFFGGIVSTFFMGIFATWLFSPKEKRD